MITTTASNHTNQQEHHNSASASASASASTVTIPPAASLPGTAAVINSFTATAATLPAPAVEESNITELLEQVQELLDKATSFNIGGVIAQSAAKRLQSVNTQLKVELLKERQRQLYDSEKVCQHELEVAQLRLATAKIRINDFLASTKKCEAKLNTLITDLAERQEPLTLQLLDMASQAQAAADEELGSS